MNLRSKYFNSRPHLIIALAVFAVLLFTSSVSAQDLTPANSASVSSVNYQLSYPGLLPDHPLHFLKATRDRIISFFISNPMEKAEFNMLQADKRVEASRMLYQKGKVDLSQSTFSKSENYFEDAINDASLAKMQGIGISEITQKLKDSNLKHQQVLSEMRKKMDPEEKKKFDKEAMRLLDFEKRVKEIKPKI